MKTFNFVLTVILIVGLVFAIKSINKDLDELQDNNVALSNEIDNLANEVENNHWVVGPVYVVEEKPVENKTSWVKPSNYQIIPYYPE